MFNAHDEIPSRSQTSCITARSISKYGPEIANPKERQGFVTGKGFKTLATRKLDDGWAIVEADRVWQQGYVETVVGRGYASEQIAEQVAKVALGFSDDLVAVEEGDC